MLCRWLSRAPPEALRGIRGMGSGVWVRRPRQGGATKEEAVETGPERAVRVVAGAGRGMMWQRRTGIAVRERLVEAVADRPFRWEFLRFGGGGGVGSGVAGAEGRVRRGRKRDRRSREIPVIHDQNVFFRTSSGPGGAIRGWRRPNRSASRPKCHRSPNRQENQGPDPMPPVRRLRVCVPR